MTKLLVSVRSMEEAAQALAGGAAVIDVKEPQFGSLGRADDTVIADVLHFVAGRCPVSAALGELLDEGPLFPAPGLSFVKWGLAGCGRISDWPKLLATHQARIVSQPSTLPECQVVFVAYADWQCAQAPPLGEVVDVACRTPGSVLLIDTCCKTSSSSEPGRRPTLLDWLPFEEAIDLCRRCRAAQVRVALAGSLGLDEIRLLQPAYPEWFAVRGAVCAEGRRCGAIRQHRVLELARWLE